MGIDAGKNVVYALQTGEVRVDPEIYTTSKCCDCFGGPSVGGDGGEAVLVMLIVIAA